MPPERLERELERRAQEPFLPAETKLVAASLALGLALLGLLVWLSNAFFTP